MKKYFIITILLLFSTKIFSSLNSSNLNNTELYYDPVKHMQASLFLTGSLCVATSVTCTLLGKASVQAKNKQLISDLKFAKICNVLLDYKKNLQILL